MFQVDLNFYVIIEGCPENGLAAIDYRRKHGISDAPSNTYHVEWKGENEVICRRFSDWLNRDSDLVACHESRDGKPRFGSHYAAPLISCVTKYDERNRAGARTVPPNLVAVIDSRKFAACDREADVASLIDLLAALEQDLRNESAALATAKAEKHAREEAARDALEAIDPRQLIDENGELMGNDRVRELLGEHVQHLTWDYICKAPVAQKAKEIAEENRLRERNDWIERHGSNRLKRLTAEGIECEAVYRDERLAHDRPGWVWARLVAGEYDDPRNASEEDLALLDKARETDKSAKLAYWTADHECDEDCYDSGNCPKYDFAGCLAVADFLGREIVFGAPESIVS